MSKKEEGNIFYKQQKFSEAIRSYKEYVKEQHDDNSKAHSNIAMAFFKLKKYEDCIEACEKAISLDPQFQKPHYRMFQVYKLIKNCYGIILSGTKYLKFIKEEKQQKETKQIINIAKQKLSFKKHEAFQGNDKLILDILKQGQQYDENKSLRKVPQISLHSKWQRILEEIKGNKYEGINKARRFIKKQCDSEGVKAKYRKFLKKAIINNSKPEILSKKKLKCCLPSAYPYQSDESSSDQQNITIEQMRKYLLQINKPTKQYASAQQNNQNIADSEQNNTKDPQALKTNANYPRISKSSEKIENNDSRQKHQSLNETKATQNQNEDIVSQQKIERLFQTHINSKMQKTDDPFDCLRDCVQDILRSNSLDRFEKEAILSMTPQKIKKFRIILKSYTGRELQVLSSLFAQNNLRSAFQRYFSKK